MNRIREWLIRKLGGHPYLNDVAETKVRYEMIPMDTKKVYASLEYLQDHKPPDSYLEKAVATELAMELLKNGLVDFETRKEVWNPESNPYGDKRRIIGTVRVVAEKQEAN